MSLKNVKGDWFREKQSYINSSSEKLDIPTSSQSCNDYLQQELNFAREENRILQMSWRQLEKDCNALQNENEQLKNSLAVERQKSLDYFNKLKYIQDHQEVFNKLKQAYISLKYNESVGRSFVEVREKSCQTWQAIICDACLRYNKTIAQENAAKPPRSISVAKRDIDQVIDTISKLKVVINNREDEYCTNRERVQRLGVEIKNLENYIGVTG